MSIRGYRGVRPKIAATAYIDPSAQVIGDVVVGERSSVWPNTTVRGDVHYIRIGDDCLIGIGAIVLNGARVGTGSIVAAGALVTEGMRVPPGSVVMGMPGKVRREA